MTSPLNASTGRDGSRYYVFGDQRLPGVSTITRMLYSRELTHWQIGRIAERFITDDDFAEQVRKAYDSEDEDYAKRKAAQTVVLEGVYYASGPEADLGTAVHKVIELSEADKIPADVEDDEELTPYLKAWNELCEKYQLKVLNSELQLAHPFHGYAGSADHLVVSPTYGPVILDVKTGKRVYSNVAMQLAAYAHANHVWNGSELVRWGSDVRKDIGLVAKISRTPGGKVTGNLYTVNLRAGWDAFRACIELYKFNERNNLITSARTLS